QRDIGHRKNDDSIVAVHLAHHDALLELADAEDRRLSLVENDGGGEQRTRHAMVGDGEAAAGYVRALELSLAGTAGEVVEPRADPPEAERSSVPHHRRDQAPL